MTKRRFGQARREQPIALADMICAAALLIDGLTIAQIAWQLRRPIPQVRAMMFGGGA